MVKEGSEAISGYLVVDRTWQPQCCSVLHKFTWPDSFTALTRPHKGFQMAPQPSVLTRIPLRCGAIGCLLLAFKRPSNMLASFRDGSAETAITGPAYLTQSQYTDTRPTSPSSDCDARVATTDPIFKSLV